MDYENTIKDLEKYILGIKDSTYYNKAKLEDIEKELKALGDAVKRMKNEHPVNEKEKAMFQRAKNKGHYYFINTHGEVDWDTEKDDDGYSKTLYDIGNYCLDDIALRQRAKDETLYRLVWRWSKINSVFIDNFHGVYWTIGFDLNLDEFVPMAFEGYVIPYDTACFPNEETCRRCIKEVVDPYIDSHKER